jgi:hypothetical protein
MKMRGTFERPFLLGIIALTVLSLWGETVVLAQTDFAAWKNPQNAETVPRWRQQLLNSRDFQNLTGTSRDELLAQTLTSLKEIAEDSNVVPSTRYNAILAVGQLVSVEPSPGTPPVAYADALTYLVDSYQEPDMPYYLQYGALLGIVRHTHCGMESAQQNKVIDLLLDTISTEFVPEETTLNSMPLEPAVWEWFRQTALEGLTGLKTIGTNGKVVTELLEVINRQSQELEDLIGSEEPLSREDWERTRRIAALATKAAKTLGDLNYASATNRNANKMIDTFIRLIRAECSINCKRATETIEKGGTSSDSAILLERIVLNVKMCIQSVGWGIRSDFLSGRPTKNSFYTSLESDEPAMKRLTLLLAEITKLAMFLDEGDGTRRPVLSANVAKEFLFTLAELRDVLAKTSDALTEKQDKEKEPETASPD